MNNLDCNNKVSGYLVIADEMPLVGYAIKAMLDNASMNIGVIQLYNLNELFEKNNLFEGKKILAVVADLIWSEDFIKNNNRISIIEILFPNVPILIFSTRIDKKIVAKFEQNAMPVSAFINRFDKEEELFNAIMETLKDSSAKKIYLSSIIKDHLKRNT